MSALRIDEEECEGEEGGEGDEYGELVEAHRLDHLESGADVDVFVFGLLAPLVVVRGRTAFGHGAAWGDSGPSTYGQTSAKSLTILACCVQLICSPRRIEISCTTCQKSLK